MDTLCPFQLTLPVSILHLHPTTADRFFYELEKTLAVFHFFHTFRLDGALFLMLVAILTYALIVGGEQTDPTDYEPLGQNIIRAICEIIVIGYFTFSFIGEVQEMFERR